MSASDVSLDAEDQKSEKGKRRRQAAAVVNEQNNWHSYSDVEADSSLGKWPDWLPRTWLMGFHPHYKDCRGAPRRAYKCSEQSGKSYLYRNQVLEYRKSVLEIVHVSTENIGDLDYF